MSVGTDPLTGSIIQRLTKGIPMSYLTLKVLTAFPPTGMLGMNHAALGNQALALIKAASVAVSILVVTFLSPYYPTWLASLFIGLSAFGPWFFFDILEVFNPSFSTKGFRVPLNITIEGLTEYKNPPYGSWKLTLPMGTAIMATLATSGVVLANYLPPSILPASSASMLSNVAGGTGFALGAVALGLMITSSSPASVATGAFTSAVPTQGGGGLPPLSSFADKLISAKSPDESLAFLSTIAVIIMGGIATAAFQRK